MEFLTGFIILGVLALLSLFGFGKYALKDFKVNTWVVIGFTALVIGLNFIPAIRWGAFSFRVGSAVLVVTAFMLHLVMGTMANKMITLVTTLILTAVTYGVTRLAAMFDGGMWANVNWVYAIIVGVIAMLVLRNAKYAFISSVVSMFAAGLLAQIGNPVGYLEAGFNAACIAGGTALVLFTVVKAMIPARPSKLSYYFESGRLSDE